MVISKYRMASVKWMPELRRFAPNVPIVLVGTKLDLREDRGYLSDQMAYNIMTTAQHRLAQSPIQRGDGPLIEKEGYLLGNPKTDDSFDENSKVLFYHRMALISDELHQSARKNCKGEYAKVDESNTLCLNDLDSVTQCINRTNQGHILELKCFSNLLDIADKHNRALQEESTDYLHLPLRYPLTECRVIAVALHWHQLWCSKCMDVK